MRCSTPRSLRVASFVVALVLACVAGGGAAANTASLSGTVTLQNQPVADAVVTASGSNLVAHTKTDAHGKFQFPSLQYGTYTVSVSAGDRRSQIRVDVGSSGANVDVVLGELKTIETKPVLRRRDAVFFFVASRPAESVKNEVSIRFGYPFKSGAEATVEIGTAKFVMNTQDDGAWIKNVAEEARLIEIMRKGTDLTVSGMSSHGTQSIDRYSLKGLGQALDRTDQECK
jgi:hypothetical protein